MHPIVFRKQALLEFDEAGDWYEKNAADLAWNFLAKSNTSFSVLLNYQNNSPSCTAMFTKLSHDASPIAFTLKYESKDRPLKLLPSSSQ